MPYINHIDYENSEGELREIYDGLIDSRGKLANIHTIQSLHPKSITAHMKLYMELMFGKSPLKRYQRELLGVIVSKSNRGINMKICAVVMAGGSGSRLWPLSRDTSP